jgi:hypothetical protein
MWIRRDKLETLYEIGMKFTIGKELAKYQTYAQRTGLLLPMRIAQLSVILFVTERDERRLCLLGRVMIVSAR